MMHGRQRRNSSKRTGCIPLSEINLRWCSKCVGDRLLCEFVFPTRACTLHHQDPFTGLRSHTHVRVTRWGRSSVHVTVTSTTFSVICDFSCLRLSVGDLCFEKLGERFGFQLRRACLSLPSLILNTIMSACTCALKTCYRCISCISHLQILNS